MDLEYQPHYNYTIILYNENSISIDKYIHNSTDEEFWNHYLNRAQASVERYDKNNRIYFYRNNDLIYEKCLGYNTSEFLLGLIYANQNGIGTVTRETIHKVNMG